MKPLPTDPIINQTILSNSETATKIRLWKNPEFQSHKRKTSIWPFPDKIIILWLTYLWLDCWLVALQWRPLTVWERVPDVDPEVSHCPPSPPGSVARCAAKAHPLLGGASHIVGGIPWAGEGLMGWWMAYVFKLSFDVEWHGLCFQTLKSTSRGSKSRFLAPLPYFID